MSRSHTETVPAESSDFDEVTMANVTHALGQLTTLTFQQRQMLRDGDVLSLLDELATKWRKFQWMYALLAAMLAVRCLSTALMSQIPWWSAAGMLFFLYQLHRSRSTVRKVTEVVRRFAARQDYTDPTCESLLLTELRTRYTLSYQQLQMVKAGEVVTVARELAADLKGKQMIGPLAISFVSITQLAAFGLRLPTGLTATPKWRLVTITQIVCHLLLPLFAVGAAVLQWRKAQRLERLIGTHHIDVAALGAGSETQSNRDSPFRTPRFR